MQLRAVGDYTLRWSAAYSPRFRAIIPTMFLNRLSQVCESEVLDFSHEGKCAVGRGVAC